MSVTGTIEFDVTTVITAIGVTVVAIGQLVLQFKNWRATNEAKLAALRDAQAAAAAAAVQLEATAAARHATVEAAAAATRATLEATDEQTRVIVGVVGEAKALSAANAEVIATVAGQVADVAGKVDDVKAKLA